MGNSVAVSVNLHCQEDVDDFFEPEEEFEYKDYRRYYNYDP